MMVILLNLLLFLIKKKDTILNYWDDLQDKHETQFEIDYMNSIQKDKGFIEEQEDEEEM